MPSTAGSPARRTSATSPGGRSDLSVAEQVCLALVVEGAGHGWAVGSELAPEGSLGRIWHLSRPLTYRAIDGLVERGLVRRRGQEAGHGRDRVVLQATAAGRRASRQWLDEPVEHLRDVRTELLVKLALRERLGLDADDLLARQAAVFEPMIDALTSGPADGDLVALWRRESARAVRRFLELARRPVPEATVEPAEMRLSARNQLAGEVVRVVAGEVLSTVKVRLEPSQLLTAVITREAAEDLDLAAGDAVAAIAKSTEVMIAKPAHR